MPQIAACLLVKYNNTFEIFSETLAVIKFINITVKHLIKYYTLLCLLNNAQYHNKYMSKNEKKKSK